MALDLGTLPEASLLDLLPIAKIEQLVKRKLTWRVYQRQDEMMQWELIPYNTCVAAHTHRASRGMAWNENPMRFWDKYQDTPQLAKKVGYKHNQAAIVATLDEDPEVVVAKLHIAAVNEDAIYLQEIVLADPSRPPTRPMGLDQEYAGLGHGIFGEILSNVRRLAGQYGRDKVILYAVDGTRAGVFARKGFSLDTSEPDLIEASRINGQQIPMLATAL